ncbi:carboxylesterase/lipase family protein [Sphaerisporangium perillae]|uniref:carboxylesterase/lipase family protein n=1 Tax=Sphaerisporangium perillae TaxID=2935860 RepID=UPI00200D1FD8|nr:carboxylesterase family protein [Sphaerisporangium perillae]
MNTGPLPVAMTSAGAVRGRTEDGLAVFRGIPFAQPPVGEARFAAPRPAVPWDGVRDAFAFGPPPPQTPMRPGAPVGPEDADDSQDWLTVNVWTHAPDRAVRRPVMVWIHGGAYQSGASASPVYNGTRLVRERDVVVVTFNYRVGMEGFARLQGAPANRGLLDQVAALRWVQENIDAFGGDPDQVTVFGESAGAGSIAALLAMPSAKGLFRRAIAQSVPGVFLSDALAADIAAALVQDLGLRPTAADLCAVDPHKLAGVPSTLRLTMARYADRWGPVAHTVTPFSPVVDGEVLPQAPWSALASGTAREVPLIVGHNRDEYRLFLAASGRLGRITDEQAATALRVFGPGSEPESAYRAAFPDASAEHLYELVQSDWNFRMPSLHLAQAHIAGGGRAHVYELTWPAPANGGLLGACHALDVPLTFGEFGEFGGISINLFGPGPSPEAEALSAWIRSAWTAFAVEGSPGWPAYDPDRRLVQVLDTETSTTAYPEEASRHLWQHHTFDALPLLATGQ